MQICVLHKTWEPVIVVGGEGGRNVVITVSLVPSFDMRLLEVCIAMPVDVNVQTQILWLEQAVGASETDALLDTYSSSVADGRDGNRYLSVWS